MNHTKNNWLKDCEICNTGLCSQMNSYIDSGLPARAAARQMEKDCDSLWSAEKIYGRYRYYVKGHSGGGSVGKPHKLSDDEILVKAEDIRRRRAFRDNIRQMVELDLFDTSLNICPGCETDPHECDIRQGIFKILQEDVNK